MEQKNGSSWTMRIRTGLCAAVQKGGRALWAGKRARLAQAVLRLASGAPCRDGISRRKRRFPAVEAENSCLAEAAAHLAAAKADEGSAAFLPDGCIGSQRALLGVPFGTRGNSPENGCGWIACYNALRLMGMEIAPETALAGIGRGARRGGRSGTNPFGLMRWLRRQGVCVQTAVTETEAEALARRSAVFIACYLYRQGAARLGGHFVAGRYDAETDALLVYNGEHGARCFEPSVAAIDGGLGIVRLLIGLDPAGSAAPRD